MNDLLPRRRHRVLAVACLAAIGVTAGACSSSGTKTSTTTGAGAATTTTVAVPAATLNGSGSTFQLAFDQEAIQEFAGLHSGVTINYPGGGSTKGLNDLAAKLTDFAGTDATIKAADLAKYGGAGAVLYVPTVAAPITMSYKLSGVTRLTLSAATIAQIYTGKITAWNNPAIAADNAGVTLPSTKITPVHRSDGSGTTNNFSLYLSKADPADWTYPAASSFPTGLPGGTGNGNPGVAQTVSATEGALGYVDYSTAKSAGLTFASIKNSAGDAVAPTLAGASAAVASAKVNPDLTYDPINAQGPGAYPITSPTWIVIYKTQTDKPKGAALKAFLDFILTTGETSVASKTGYAPLQGQLLQMARDQLSQIVIPA